MFVYMLQKGVAKGYLDSTYLDVVDKGWVGMQNNITLDSKKQPVINNFVLGMGIKSSYSVYVRSVESEYAIVEVPTWLLRYFVAGFGDGVAKREG